jgi:transcription initiation factor TFIID subunit TAF12
VRGFLCPSFGDFKMGVFSNIVRGGKKIYESGAPDASMPPRQQRRVDVATPPAVAAPANRDARLTGSAMGGMVGQAVGAMKGRRQRIEDAINEATGYKCGGLVKRKR